jgi:signal peptide peptidase SppA
MVIQPYEKPLSGDEGEDELPTSGLSVIPIAGPLVPRSGNLQMCQQMTAYEQVAAQIDCSLSDPNCTQIVFDIDSPGGASTGAFELANKIRVAGSVKPTTAIVNFNAMSGAYLIAAACNEISLSQTGGVGSIGVIAQHMDVSKMNETMGLKITAIYRGDKKNNLSPNEPLSESSLNELDQMVEKTYQQFVSTVAQFRSLPLEQVINTQAGLYFGQDAIDAGLADRLETPQDAINRIALQAVQNNRTRMTEARRAQISRQSFMLRARAMNLSINL